MQRATPAQVRALHEISFRARQTCPSSSAFAHAVEIVIRPSAGCGRGHGSERRCWAIGSSVTWSSSSRLMVALRPVAYPACRQRNRAREALRSNSGRLLSRVESPRRQSTIPAGTPVTALISRCRGGLTHIRGGVRATNGIPSSYRSNSAGSNVADGLDFRCSSDASMSAAFARTLARPREREPRRGVACPTVTACATGHVGVGAREAISAGGQTPPRGTLGSDGAP